MDGHAVTTGLGHGLEVLLRALDHEMAVEDSAEAVDDRGDRLQDDRPDCDRRDEVAVAHVEMEDAHPRARERLDLLAEPREVGRIQRRLDFDGANPVLPAHGR